MAQILGLGVPADQLTYAQVALRACVVCVMALVIVRVAHRRFLAQLSAFDAVVVFLLASMLARAVNGTVAFGPTIAGGFVIVLLHRALAALAFRFPRFGNLIKGRPRVLVRHGVMLDDQLRETGVSREDVREQARLHACLDRDEDIALATLERNGQVSVVPEQRT